MYSLVHIVSLSTIFFFLYLSISLSPYKKSRFSSLKWKQCQIGADWLDHGDGTKAITFKNAPFWSPLKCSEQFLKHFFLPAPIYIYTDKKKKDMDPKVTTRIILHEQASTCIISLEGP